MSSCVFYKFKSSKEPSRITFDGLHITVFELKRDIINASGLGDGTDFDLTIYNEDTNEEYDDDTTLIPRSSHIIARRFPASKPGHGRAARYVSGKMPVNAKNSYRTESNKPGATKGPNESDGIRAMNNAQTEEEKIAAMFKAGEENWQQQQEKMAAQKPVFRGGYQKRPANVPDHDPPPGYICFRCHQKGHWIQVCPTNDDPNFENRPRIKRTTGIPRSFLKTVDKSTALAGDEDGKQPSGVMVNAEGQYVIAEPDKASWEQFQAKAKAAAAQEEAAKQDNKEIRERGLECSLDKRLFVEPVKTPCCGKTFCNDCIENALVNSDLVCPECRREGVLLDDLAADEDMARKIKEFEEEKAASAAAAKRARSKSPKQKPLDAPEEAGTPGAADAKDGESNEPDDQAAKSPSVAASAESKTEKPHSPAPSSNAAVSKTPESSTPSAAPNGSTKKRPAEEELKNDRIPTGPAAMRNKQQQQDQQQQNPMAPPPSGYQEFIAHMNALAQTNGNPGSQAPFPTSNGTGAMPGPMGGFQGMNGAGPQGGMPMFQNGMMGMPLMSSVPGMMPMGNGAMMNPMMAGGAGGWGDMSGGGGMYGQAGMYGGFNPSMMNGGWNNGGGSQQGWHGGPGGGGRGHHNQMHGGGSQGAFPNQQRTNFSEPFPNEEDNAYFRKPVNPHRHLNRQRRQPRPSDYTEL
ncbi:DWNN domain-containing protein [Lineolata rhizophorae]|uniref:DWNN domain-containing protein n=1 Tax=Lineolata rhizophorae TaxID=578093 RepID=A0A6A6NVD8_9PEZI|nr:DWNN domain-containing protein [Lineolata rhizophorae]